MSDQHLDQLIAVFEKPAAPAASVLGGRTSASRIHLDGIGSMVVKHYMRGGWVRRIVEDRYVRWGRPRCRSEFDMLSEVGRRGVRVPEPIAFACRGQFFYRCWLITRQIPLPQNLAEMSRVDPRAALAAIPLVADQIRRLIQHRIWHVDLHPGNVLVDSHHQAYLIDFDRAKKIRSAPSRLHDKYLRRWRRAVEKHGLPLQLAQHLEAAMSRTPTADGFTGDRRRFFSSDG